MILILKTDIMDPVMQCTTFPCHSESLKRFLFHFSRRSTRFYRLSHSEIVDIEKVAVCSSLRLPNNKCALIECKDRSTNACTGRYRTNWRSTVLTYIDTRPNGDAIRKAHFGIKKRSDSFDIGRDLELIYSIIDACQDQAQKWGSHRKAYNKERCSTSSRAIDWLSDTDEEIDEKSDAHLQLHGNESRSVETDDSNVTPGSPDSVINVFRNDQNDVELVESLEDELVDLESDKADFQHVESAFARMCECQEQLKNDTVCKEKASNVFRKEREQYFEIQDLKAQLQDKNIAISELKKLIEKYKGKSVDTKFDKPFVVRHPNAQRILKPSVLGKPASFSDSLERKYFAKKKSVLKTNESEGLSKPANPQNLPQTAKTLRKTLIGLQNALGDYAEIHANLFLNFISYIYHKQN
ncbi:hypothetical protein Tco_0827746 [Tanacetum coccineum]